MANACRFFQSFWSLLSIALHSPTVGFLFVHLSCLESEQPLEMSLPGLWLNHQWWFHWCHCVIVYQLGHSALPLQSSHWWLEKTGSLSALSALGWRITQHLWQGQPAHSWAVMLKCLKLANQCKVCTPPLKPSQNPAASSAVAGHVLMVRTMHKGLLAVSLHVEMLTVACTTTP